MAVPPGLAEFCEREHPRLVRALVLYGAEAETASELAQDALVRACSNWKKVRGMQAPEAWLTRVAINLANSHYRRRSAERRARLRLERERTTGDGFVLEVLISEPIRNLAALPKRQRTALILRHFVGLPTSEVADQMGSSESAVRRLTAQALGSLRRDELLMGTLEVDDV